MLTMKSSETSKTIQMLPIKQLSPHPQNPRSILGDLQELADSIRENGILQNLTVVPWIGEVSGKPLENIYKVIIGHRRLAAAKMAGLDAVPCVVAQMTPAEQIKTMLMENMHRCDLTPLEQADGFQMVLDLGVTLEEVAKESGFSQTTVRRRLKLRELDRKTLETRLTQGATLMDLVKLEQIEDEKARNKVLAAVGTSNFEYMLKVELDSQTRQANKPLWMELLSSFAGKIPKGDSAKWQHVRWYSLSQDPKEFKMPDDAGSANYGYTMDSSSFSLCKLRDNAAEIDKADAEKNEKENRVIEVVAALKAASQTAYELRYAFIKQSPLGKKHIPDAIAYLLSMLGNGNIPKDGAMNRVLDVPTGQGWLKDANARRQAFASLLQANPDRALLIMIYAVCDASGDYVKTFWEKHSYPKFQENPELDRFYDFLELLGYQISDEEQLLMSGKHPLF